MFDDEDDANDFAMAVMSMVVGALTLSPLVMKDDEVSDKLLLAARKAILEYGRLRKKPSEASSVEPTFKKLGFLRSAYPPCSRARRGAWRMHRMPFVAGA